MVLQIIKFVFRNFMSSFRNNLRADNFCNYQILLKYQSKFYSFGILLVKNCRNFRFFMMFFYGDDSLCHAEKVMIRPAKKHFSGNKSFRIGDPITP